MRAHRRRGSQTHLIIELDRQCKGEVIELQVWTGPHCSRMKLPRTSRQSVHEGGNDFSPTHRPPLPPTPQEISMVLISVRS